MEEEDIKKLAEEHWIYVESICHKMYVDAFIHGFKHGNFYNIKKGKPREIDIDERI